MGRRILSMAELKLLPVTDCHLPLTLCGSHRACGGLSESHRWPGLTDLLGQPSPLLSSPASEPCGGLESVDRSRISPQLSAFLPQLPTRSWSHMGPHVPPALGPGR